MPKWYFVYGNSLIYDYWVLTAVNVKYQYHLLLAPAALKQVRSLIVSLFVCFLSCEPALEYIYFLIHIIEVDEWKIAFFNNIINALSVFQTFLWHIDLYLISRK